MSSGFPSIFRLQRFLRGVTSLFPCLALLFWLAAPLSARAEAEGMRLLRFTPTAGRPQYLQTAGSRVLDHLQVGGGLYLDLALQPLRQVERGTETTTEIVSRQLALHGIVGLGLLDRFELALALPWVVHQAGNLLPLGRTDELAASALGDLRVAPKVRLLDNTAGGPGLALRALVTLPLGQAADLAAEAGLTWETGLVGEWRFGPRTSVGLNAGFLWREADRFLGIDVGNMLTYGLGAELGLHPQFGAVLDLAGGLTLGGQDALQAGEQPAEVLAGLRWYGPRGLAVTLAGGAGLSAGYGNPRQRVVLQVALGGEEAAPSPPPEPEPEPPVVVVPPTRPELPANLAVLIANRDGTTGAIVVRNDQGEQVADRARQGIPMNPGEAPGDPIRLTEEEIRRLFGAALDAEPEPPVSYVLYFERDTTRLTKESKAVLAEVIAALRSRPVPDVSIIGHTDRSAGEEHNHRLALSRARAVEKLFRKQAPGTRILEVVSHGEENPLIETDDGVREPRNRRVEIMVR